MVNDNSKYVLVTGAAGYIGSVVTEELIKDGKRTIALDNLAQGHMHVLIGPNGAGKSTLLRLLIGLSLPDEGRVELFGKHLDDNEVEIKLQTGYVAQEMDFPSGMRNKQCLDFVVQFLTRDAVK